MEHAAVAELVRRRVAEAQAGGARSQEVPRYAAAEIAAALGLTGRSADGLMGRAMSLDGLPATWAALSAGQIDMPKALVIVNGVAGLSSDLARAVEAQVLPGAGGQTTGQLRAAVAAAVAAAVITADPAAADQRAAEAQRCARVEQWAEPCGTAAIAGRDLPTASALAAGNRINALAAALKADGAPGGIDLLRAQVFLGLLLGHPVAAPATETPPDAADVTDGTAPDAAGVAADLTAVGLVANTSADTVADTTTGPAANAGPETGATGPAAATGPPGAPSPGAAADLGDAMVPGSMVPGGGASKGSSARPSGAACGGGQPTGLHSQAEQITAGETEAIPAGLRRVPAGVGQLAGQPGASWPGMVGSVNLTVPLRALLGEPSQPAEAAGFGPLTPSVSRELLTAAQHNPAVTWCLTITGDDGRAVAHACATPATGKLDHTGGQDGPARREEPGGRGGPAQPGGLSQRGQPGGSGQTGGPGQQGQRGGPGEWRLTLTMRALETGDCSHRRESRGYQPAPMLRHLIQTRNKTCAFPGCRRPARLCDLDHTVAFQDGGRTCECNLAPLCRKHHKVKQALGWRLEQISPGVLEWVAPSGWRYTINPSQQPI